MCWHELSAMLSISLFKASVRSWLFKGTSKHELYYWQNQLQVLGFIGAWDNALRCGCVSAVRKFTRYSNIVLLMILILCSFSLLLYFDIYQVQLPSLRNKICPLLPVHPLPLTVLLPTIHSSFTIFFNSLFFLSLILSSPIPNVTMFIKLFRSLRL